MKRSRNFAGKYPELFLLVALLLPGMVFTAEREPPLHMGILPYLSTEQLFKFFTPMKVYLEQRLQRSVVMTTAPNFRTFIERAAHADYDIYVTAPHFALLAEQQSGYRGLVRMTRNLDAAIFVRKDDVAKRIEDLRSRRIASPNTLALTSILGEQMLRGHGLEAGRDYVLQDAFSHNNALMRVAEYDADAALTSVVVLEHMPPSVRDRLRVLVTAPQVPQLMVLASPKLPETDYRSLSQALLAFTHQGPGREFFDLTGNVDVAPITQADMDALKPFLPILKERLK